MLKVYTGTYSTTSRKVVKWLEEEHIPFQRIKVTKDSLDIDELKHLFQWTDSGLFELLINNINKDAFHELSLNEAIEVVVKNLKLLRKPILFDGEKLQVGYNVEEIQIIFQIKKVV